MASFEGVADEYDDARPSYPAGVFDALGPLRGRRVLDVGAGTGIATRQLIARAASVVALDPGPGLLTRAVRHTPDLRAVVADGGVLPIAEASFDLVTFAQSWHWLDPATRCAEAHRVLRHGGRWAGWWSHARADADTWFDTYWALIEAACPGVSRRQRDTDWGATVAASGLFEVGERIEVPWTRRTRVEDWITDLTSHSYVAALPQQPRRLLLADLRLVLRTQFPDGSMVVPYETWLWIGTRYGPEV